MQQDDFVPPPMITCPGGCGKEFPVEEFNNHFGDVCQECGLRLGRERMQQERQAPLQQDALEKEHVDDLYSKIFKNKL